MREENKRGCDADYLGICATAVKPKYLSTALILPYAT